MSTDDTNAGTATAPAEEKPKLNLAVEITDSGPCRKHVRVTIPRADIDEFYGDELDEFIDQAVVPGFRKGHVPQKLVERRFKKELSDQVKQKILFESLEQVAADHKIDPINEPELDIKTLDIPEEGDFEYEFDVEVRPVFDLPDYAGLKIERPVRDISDADVERAQQRYLSQYGTLEDRDGPAQPGDWLEVSGEFTSNGRPLSSFQRREIQLLPKLRFQDAELPGFDKLMAGVKPGDTRETDVTVSSEAANIELRGEKVHVVFTVQNVYYRKLPELTTEFFNRIGLESEEELKDEIKKALDRQLKFEQRQTARKQVLSKITASADWGLPEGAVRRQVENALRREILEMQQAGYTMQEIRSRENALRQNAITTTQQALKEHFVLDKIATEEKVTVDNNDLDAEIRLMAMQSGESPRRVRARLIRTGIIENLEAQIRERKAIEVILDRATYVDTPAPMPKDNDTEAIAISVCGEAAAPVATDEGGDEEE